jgi:hypothetical protein
VSAPKNGLANILFNFVALKARWNSRAREKGCSALGVRVTDEAGSCVIVAIFTIVERQYYNTGQKQIPKIWSLLQKMQKIVFLRVGGNKLVDYGYNKI